MKLNIEKKKIMIISKDQNVNLNIYVRGKSNGSVYVHTPRMHFKWTIDHYREVKTRIIASIYYENEEHLTQQQN